MKENLDIMAAGAGVIAAFLKGLKKKFSKREIVINMIVGGVLSFGSVAAALIYLPNYISDTRILFVCAYFIGWVSNEFTDSLEKAVERISDALIEFFRSKLGVKNKHSGDDEQQKPQIDAEG